MTTFVTVTETPGRPGRFDASAGGMFVASTRTPLLSFARKLKDLGFPDTEELVMVGGGDRNARMRTTVGVASSLTVEESDKRSPTFQPYRPYPTSQNAPPAVTVAPDFGRLEVGGHHST